MLGHFIGNDFINVPNLQIKQRKAENEEKKFYRIGRPQDFKIILNHLFLHTILSAIHKKSYNMG